MRSNNVITHRIFLLIMLLGLCSGISEVHATHAQPIVNPSLNISGGNILINGFSASGTCGSGPYVMEVEIKCNTIPFTGVPNASSQMEKTQCVLQQYPTIVIPLTNLCPGVTYKWQIREHIMNTNPLTEYGPWSATFTFTTPGISTISPNLSAVPASICPGQNAQITSSPYGACQGPVTYSWSHGLGTSSTVTVNPTVTTTYTVTVTDACGVSGTQSVTVNITPPPTVGTASVSPNPVCPGSCVTLTLTGSSVGSFGNTVQWQRRNPPGAWQNITGATSLSYQYCPVNSQTYFRAMIISPCYAPRYSNTVIVNLASTPSAQITGQPGNDCNSSITVPYTAPGQANVTYSWAVTGGTPASGTGNSINVAWGTSGGSITLTATNTVTGCTNTSTLQIAPCCQMTYHPYYINNIKASDIINDPLLPGNYLTYNNGVYQLSHHYIVINGVFTVDIPFELVPSAWNPSAIGDVFLGGNAQIQIDPGITFKIDRHALKPCTYMWDGIYINGTTSSLVTTNGTSMQGAKNAVVSVNGGHFDLSNTTFLDNYSCVKVNAYAGSHTGTIRTCTFTTSGNTFAPSLPAALFPINRTLFGVEAHDVGSITIGDPSSLANQNIFDNLGSCIWSDVSNMKVYNNIFRQTNTVYGANTYGIVANSSKLNPRSLIVGGFANNETNRFDNNWKAIYAYNAMNVTVQNNTINNSTHSGINIFQCRSQNILLENNSLEIFMNGIVCTDNILSTIDIKNNDLNQVQTSSTSQTGILVQNPVLSKMNLTVSQNDIARCRTGIWTISAEAVNSTSFPPRIVYNNIDFSGFPTGSITTTHYGIRAQDARAVIIENNNIFRNIPPILAISSLLRGIEVENSVTPYVNYNSLTSMGRGINMKNFVAMSKLTCNDLTTNYDGFYFDNTFLLWHQYFGQPNDNTYTGNLFSDLAGSNAPIADWFHQQIPLAYIPLTNNALGIFLVPNNSSTSACGPINPPPIAQREYELGSIIRNDNEYPVHPDELRYWERQTAHWKLSRNSDLLTLGGIDDVDYQDFYNSEDAGNIGAFNDVLEHIENGNINNAVAMNNALAGTNTIEINRRAVNDIYMDTWAKGYEELDQSQVDILTAVAYLDPVTNGDAVYTARVMLGIDPEPSTARMHFDEDTTPLQANSSNVYPNPSKGQMSMDYELKIGSTGELSLFDLNGRLIKTYVLDQGKHTLTIDVRELNNGMYMYRVTINDLVTSMDKLIIIK